MIDKSTVSPTASVVIEIAGPTFTSMPVVEDSAELSPRSKNKLPEISANRKVARNTETVIKIEFSCLSFILIILQHAPDRKPVASKGGGRWVHIRIGRIQVHVIRVSSAAGRR